MSDPRDIEQKSPQGSADAGRTPRDPARKIIALTVSSRGAKPTEATERTLRFDKDRVVMGSVVSADLRLQGDGVAPIHAVLEISKDDETGAQVISIYDLASESGVYVNDAKVVSQNLKDGDELSIGMHRVRIELEAIEQAASRSGSRSRVIEVGDSGEKLYVGSQEDLASFLQSPDDERFIEEIFDYRPSSKQALEVVMSWHDAILEVEHFVRERAVTVGTGQHSDFAIPPLLASKKFALAARAQGGFVLNLDPHMKGVIQKKGKLINLEDVQTAGSIPIESEDFAKIRIGEIDFYLSYTAAPPRLKRSRLWERDPFFTKIVLTSLALTALLLGTILNLKIPDQIDAEQVPERIATILYQPEKYVRPPEPRVKTPPAEVEQPTPVKTEPPVVKRPEPKPTPKETVKLEIKPKNIPTPKPVPKEMNVAKTTPKEAPKPVPVATSKAAGGKSQNQAKEGEGARAKGTEGSRGSKTGPSSKTPQDTAKRPSPQGGAGAGDSNSQVPDEGNLDALKMVGAKMENMLSGSGAHLGKGGNQLKGFGGFTTRGNGGLALSGKGAGGGGDAESLGGLGTKGRGGGRVGTGMGAAGNGNGIVGGSSRVAIRTGGPEEAVVMGAIDADAVEAALLAHRDEFRNCYEREINAEHPSLAGRVGTSFVIGSTGRVTQAGIASTTLKNANVEACIIRVIKRIDFPIPRGAGMVQVTYPFKFAATGG